MQVSVVIPVHNEADNIGSLLGEVCAALRGQFVFEIVVVNDGSTDRTEDVLQELSATVPELVLLRHRFSCGQSAAVMTGIDHCRAPFVGTLDGDGQNDPADLPAMLQLLMTRTLSDGLQMVAGHRVRREDSRWRLLCSRIANRIRACILKDATPDSGCGIKVFRRDAFLKLPRFSHMHRFLPALIVRSGGRVCSMPVNHRPRVFGKSHYDTLRRALNGLIDLAGVAWLRLRTHLPETEVVELTHDGRTNLADDRLLGATSVHGQVRRSVA